MNKTQKYSIGLDYGTLSARAVLAKVDTGEIVAESIYGYQDAVIEHFLPGTDISIPDDYALQNPRDYQNALEALLSDVWSKAKIDPADVIGIGVAFTSCTILAVDEDFTPLCYKDEFKKNPHSWVKLWKHHGGQWEADRINAVAKERQDPSFAVFNYKINSENMYPKMYETFRKAPEVYNATYRFIEGADWIVYLLTGNERRSKCMASYKAAWDEERGYPSKDFFAALDPGFADVTDKLGPVFSIDGCAGVLKEEVGKKVGLPGGIAVGIGNTDAHVTVPAVGVTAPGTMVMIMGTSLCHMTLAENHAIIPGTLGLMKDGILPGFYGLEAGQSAVGDIFDWYGSRFASYECASTAAEENKTILAVMNENSEKIEPGSSGLLAIDWWNGNRSMLANANLTGMILGMNLSTTNEEIYRALIEATAYGTRTVVEAIQEYGIKIDRIVACGGLSHKARLVMQIFSDVLNMPIWISATRQTTSLGAAMYGTIAAGSENGGYDSIYEASGKMSRVESTPYMPQPKNVAIYDKLYAQYKNLHQFFGVDHPEIMADLLKIKRKA